MTIDEAVKAAQMEIDIIRQNPSGPDAYDVLRICEHLLNVILLLRKAGGDGIST